MSKIKLIVFDIAGTTVKDNGEIAIAFAGALKEFGYHVPTSKINPLMGYKKPQAIRMMVEEYESDQQKITDEYIHAIHERFLQRMIEHYKTTNEITPLPNVMEVFSFVKNKGVKIGLDTGFSSDITEVIMNRLGWLSDGIVDYVVSSNQVQAGRPEPFMIKKIMHEAGISNAQQVIKVGDTEVDVQEGKNAGCLYSIAVTTGAFTREELLPHEPSFIIDDMQQLLPIIEPLL